MWKLLLINQAITTGEKEIAEAIATLCKYFEKNVYMSGDGYGCQSSKNSRGYRDKVYCFSQYRSAGKQKTIEMNSVSMPGDFTPSEIVCAYVAGANFVKVFSAVELRIGYLKAILRLLTICR